MRTAQVVKRIEGVLADPTAHTWLKDALRTAMQCDPMDASCDAQLLARVLGERAVAIAQDHQERVTIRAYPNGWRRPLCSGGTRHTDEANHEEGAA